MLAKSIAPGLYVIALGMVNVVLLESQDGLVLFDTGMPHSAEKILQALGELGKQPQDLHHIVLTHAHPDHIGSLAALQRAAPAQTYIHPIDAPIAQKGGDFDPRDRSIRPFDPAPGLIIGLLYRLFIRPYPGVEGSRIDHEIKEGDSLPFDSTLRPIFTPGHSLGHLAFLWEQHGGILIAGDTCANMPMLNWSLGYEDLEQGKHSLKKLCQYDFEVAIFGHGSPITKDAAKKWRKKWGRL